MTDIVSAQDDRLGDYARLTDPPFRVADEIRRGYFIVESVQPLRVALGAVSPNRVRSVLVTPDQRVALADILEPVCDRVLVASSDVMREIVGFNLHRGALAAIDRPQPQCVETVIEGARLVGIAEALNDHENLGSLFRNAAALGVDALLLDPTCADPLYRRSVRVSIGHVLTVPWTRVERWPDQLDSIRSAGFAIAALTPAADAIPIDEFADQQRGAVALLLGAEGPGLSDAALASADIRVRVPMRRGVDSLNVATAAAIAFHRLARTT